MIPGVVRQPRNKKSQSCCHPYAGSKRRIVTRAPEPGPGGGSGPTSGTPAKALETQSGFSSSSFFQTPSTFSHWPCLTGSQWVRKLKKCDLGRGGPVTQSRTGEGQGINLTAHRQVTKQSSLLAMEFLFPRSSPKCPFS